MVSALAGDAFVQAGQIAFGRNVSPPFSPYLDDISLYEGAFIFEVRWSPSLEIWHAPLLLQSCELSCHKQRLLLDVCMQDVGEHTHRHGCTADRQALGVQVAD